MSFDKSEISTMTFDELRNVKLHISREQNKFAQGGEQWCVAETLRMCIESRENELEEQYVSEAKNRGAKFCRCSSCAKDKPLEDHPYGFMFRVGKTVTVCKRCQRNKTRNHHANDPEKGRARAERNQNKRKTLGIIDNAERTKLRQRQNDKCAYCGEDLKGGGELDHFVPVESGGVNTIDNRVLACVTCNRNKGRKMPGDFLHWRKIHKLCIRSGGFYEPDVR